MPQLTICLTMEAHNSGLVLLFDMKYPEHMCSSFCTTRNAWAGVVHMDAALPCLWSLRDKKWECTPPSDTQSGWQSLHFSIYTGMVLKKETTYLGSRTGKL